MTFMVVDECHRGNLLDREMSDAELSFRGQEDYISKYRRVLEYFDAVKVGLTATPALHTTDIFGDPIFTYSYRQAVIDGYLIDHEPPVRIETALARAGITFQKGEQLDLLNTSTGEIDLVHAPDEIRFEVDQFNKQVVTPEFNRVVAEELANHRCWQNAHLRSDRCPRGHCGERHQKGICCQIRRHRRRRREEDHR
jgi:type I restriction enzyme, R subunit